MIFTIKEDPQCSFSSKLSSFDCFLKDDSYKEKSDAVNVFYSSAAIVTAYETNTQHDPNNNNAMLGVHASASAIIQYGKIGRKQVRI